MFSYVSPVFSNKPLLYTDSLTHLKAGSLPKKVMNTIKDMAKTTMRIFFRVSIVTDG